MSRSIWASGWARRSRASMEATLTFFLGWDEGACVGGWLGLFSVLSAWVQIHEHKGVNAPEMLTQVDLLSYQAFPRKLILVM